MTRGRVWTWHVDNDPGLGQPVDIEVSLEAGVLTYVGWCYDLGFGGPWAIGSQTVAEFLADGPLDGGAPQHVVDEIRALVSTG